MAYGGKYGIQSAYWHWWMGLLLTQDDHSGTMEAPDPVTPLNVVPLEANEAPCVLACLLIIVLHR